MFRALKQKKQTPAKKQMHKRPAGAAQAPAAVLPSPFDAAEAAPGMPVDANFDADPYSEDGPPPAAIAAAPQHGKGAGKHGNGGYAAGGQGYGYGHGQDQGEVDGYGQGYTGKGYGYQGQGYQGQGYGYGNGREQQMRYLRFENSRLRRDLAGLRGAWHAFTAQAWQQSG